MTSHDVNLRLATLETKIDLIDGRINELTETIAEAMKLFSHSESSTHIESTEKRFQSHLADTTGIQSRYRGAILATGRVEAHRSIKANYGTA